MLAAFNRSGEGDLAPPDALEQSTDSCPESPCCSCRPWPPCTCACALIGLEEFQAMAAPAGMIGVLLLELELTSTRACLDLGMAGRGSILHTQQALDMLGS